MNQSTVRNGDTIVKPRREFTITSFFLGVILSVVMGAANVYLGLRAGMTVSASIPAAVIAMGILHGVFKRESILESNMVQTGASAGESLAAGIIFTMPALILVGLWETFDYWTTTIIAMAGGLLGILFMIPMRKVFVVDNPELKFPEGVACAEVLRAGEGEATTETGAKYVFQGLAFGAIFKFISSFLGLIKGSVEYATFVSSRVFFFGSDVSPALVSVGVIVGLPIAAQIFMGGALGWLIIMPFMLAEPGAESAVKAAEHLWDTHIRYIGVGTMVVGGVISIWRVRQGLVEAVKGLSRRLPKQEGLIANTEKNLGGITVFLLSVLCIALIAGLYYKVLNAHAGITSLITVIMIVMAFFFTAVASYIVGLVGNSNSPVSGMTITTVLITGLLIFLFGYSGVEGMMATLGVAGVVCCVACTSGDVCNDLKTGYIVGATPKKQQIMQIIGVLAASFILAPVLVVLHEGSINNGTGGIGGSELPAPQAKLFSALVNGFFGDGDLPWDMVGWGVAIGVVLLFIDKWLEMSKSEFRLHVMPVAVGIYLPLGLSAPIFFGGLLHAFISRKRNNDREMRQKRGTLIASGLIAGESLIGVLIGFLAYMRIKSLALGEYLGHIGFEAISVVGLLFILFWIYRRSVRA